MTYIEVGWADTPSTASPIDAANLKHMDDGIKSSLQTDGSATSTAAQPVSVTLSGSNKTVADWTATDGKHWQLIITTNGLLSLYDVTDAVTVASFAQGSVWVLPQFGFGTTPLVTFPIGDNDTGIAWIADDHIQIVSNSTSVMDISGGNLINITATLQNNGNQVPSIFGGGKRITVASTAPSSPAVGDVWIDASISLG